MHSSSYSSNNNTGETDDNYLGESPYDKIIELSADLLAPSANLLEDCGLSEKTQMPDDKKEEEEAASAAAEDISLKRSSSTSQYITNPLKDVIRSYLKVRST